MLERVEELGYGAVWYPETPIGRDAVSAAALLLASSKTLTVGSGIANIWARDATAAGNAALALNEAYDGRFLLGLGVSHAPAVAARGHDYAKPLSAMSRYLDALDEVADIDGDRRPAPRVLAALAPRMLDLARERAAGALTYFVPVEHTEFARDRLGADRALAVELAIVIEPDREVARERARVHTRHYLGLANYRNSLLRLGFSEDEFERGGSDDLVDRIVACGDLSDVMRRIHEHLDAGADHVAVQVLSDDIEDEVAALEKLVVSVETSEV